MAKRVTKHQEERRKAQEKSRRTRLIIGIVLILAAAAAVVIGAYAFQSEQDQNEEMQLFREDHEEDGESNYEDVVSHYYQAILSQDGQEMVQIMAPPEYWTYYLETYDKSEEEVIETFAEMCATIMTDWESEYGSGITLTYQILGVFEPSQDGLDEWNTNMETLLGNDGAEITDAVMLEIALTVTGDSDSEILTYYPTIAQMGDSWYMLEEDNDELQGTSLDSEDATESVGS